MKPFFTSLALLLISSLLFAVDETILQQLKNVNTNWNNIPAFNPQLLEQRQIQSEQELIQTHLKFTIQYLESNRQDLSLEQKQNRNACINKLKQYQAQGVFPVNTHHLCRQPYFIDDFNNYCAVASMQHPLLTQDQVDGFYQASVASGVVREVVVLRVMMGAVMLAAASGVVGYVGSVLGFLA